jgi:hypothetical protein
MHDAGIIYGHARAQQIPIPKPVVTKSLTRAVVYGLKRFPEAITVVFQQAAVFFYSRNRGGEHPARDLADYAGILKADAYAGFGDLYGIAPGRKSWLFAGSDRGGQPRRSSGTGTSTGSSTFTQTGCLFADPASTYKRKSTGHLIS